MGLKEGKSFVKANCQTGMMDLYINQSKFLHGYYLENNYYCVWVANQTPEQIADTETHEKCHHMVWMDHQHFCNGGHR
jgi:hypothetical protein